ncbi:MAG: hypothetical protein BGO26_04545 [Actinobacteria bacterium 69-20]|nr:MAG: hypothetical protein BGO26_04545 [Actinobacteria bacterium 69-20]
MSADPVTPRAKAHGAGAIRSRGRTGRERLGGHDSAGGAWHRGAHPARSAGDSGGDGAIRLIFSVPHHFHSLAE